MKTVGDGAFRREDLNSRSNDMTYSGALSFLRRKYSRDLKGVDVFEIMFMIGKNECVKRIDSFLNYSPE